MAGFLGASNGAVSIAESASPTVVKLADTLAYYGGSKCVWTGGDYIFATNGGGSLYRYSISGDSWSTMAAPTVNGSGSGDALIWDGGDYLYALFYNSSAMYRYSISGNTWATLATNVGPTASYSGACMAYTGGDYIYVCLGGSSSTSYFQRYQISTNTWTQLANAAIAGTNNSCLLWDGGDSILLFLPPQTNGNYPTVLKFSISLGSWKTIFGGTIAGTATFNVVTCDDGFLYAFYASGVWSKIDMSRDSSGVVATLQPLSFNNGSMACSVGNSIYIASTGTSSNWYRIDLYGRNTKKNYMN